MSLYADCKVIVDNNQLQHQACDPSRPDQVLMTCNDRAGFQE